MSNEDLIKNYKREKFNIEQDINREEDTLLKYQLKKDQNAVTACRERLSYLYSELKRINEKISELENGSEDNLDSPIPVPTQLQNIDNLPIDDGTATVRFSMTNVTEGTKGHGNNKVFIHQTETKVVEKTVEVKNNNIISEIQTESSSKTTEKRKNDAIDVNAKLLD